jgi:hypothetical protein
VDDEILARSARTDTPRQQRKTRRCRSCSGTGWVLADAEYNPSTGELVEESVRCFICRGEGTVYVYGCGR